MNDIIYFKRFVSLYWHFIGEVEAMHRKAVAEDNQHGIELTTRKLKELHYKVEFWKYHLNREVRSVKRRNNKSTKRGF